MKLVASVFAVVAGVTAFQSALAKEVVFKFDVNSSGPEIYPCDAGLTRNKVPTEFCHYKGTTKPCSKQEVGKQLGDILDTNDLKNIIFDKDEAHACVCAGSDGGWLLDYMTGVYETWSPDGVGHADDNHGGWSESNNAFNIAGIPIGFKWGNTTYTPAVAAKKLSVAQLHGLGDTPMRKEFRTQIEKLTFNFGSEQYGNLYYVDLCYRGPQIPWPDANTNVGLGWTPGYGISAWLGYTDITPVAAPGTVPNRSYVNLAKPKYSTKLICEWQDAAHGIPDETFTFGHLTEDLTQWPQLADLGGGQYTGGIDSPTLVSSGLTDALKSTDKRRIEQGLRFCKMRFLFEETATGYERGWQRHDGRFFVKLNLEEQPAEPSTPN